MSDPADHALAAATGLRALVAELVEAAVARALDKLRQPDQYLSTRQAAELAGVAQGTIRRWIRAGRLRAAGAGRLVRVRRADVEALLRSGGTRARAAADMTPEQLAAARFGGP
jgi:excisionase family DNA binding protein